MSDGDSIVAVVVVSSGVQGGGAGRGDGERREGRGAEFGGAGECELALRSEDTSVR